MLMSSGIAEFPGSVTSPQDLFIETCFEPKAVIFFESGVVGQTSGYGTANDRAYLSYGFGTRQGGSSTIWCQVYRYDGAAAFFHDEDYSDFGHGMSVDATLQAFSATGFTLRAPGASIGSFFWLALGGDNMESYVGTFNLPSSGSTSDIVVTGVGFQPDFLMCFSKEDSEFIGANMGFGMASSSSSSDQGCLSNNRWILGERFQRFETGKLCCDYSLHPNTQYVCHLKSFDSDGFTVGVDSNTNDGSAGQRFLAIKDPDGAFKVGCETQKTSTGTKATTGVGFQPGGGLFFGSGRTADGAASVSPHFSIGAANGPLTGLGAMELFSQDTTKYQNIRGAADIVLTSSALDTTLLSEAAVASWDADGFTLDWTTADAVARKFVYGVFETTQVDPCRAPFLPQIYRRL